LEYFSAKDLSKFRLVCHQWKDVIKNIPVSIKLKGDYESYWRISASFDNINTLQIQIPNRSFNEQALCEFLQKYKQISNIESNIYSTPIDFSWFPNPQFIKKISKARIIGSFEKLSNLEDLRFAKRKELF
jgi:hypothetical protein